MPFERDLLGINIKIKEQLPEDGSADGFDNASAASHTSSFLIEKYLEAAETALNMAIADRPKPPSSTKHRWSVKDGYPVKGSDATRHHCADCVGLPPDMRKIFERFSLRVAQLERQLEQLKRQSNH